MGYDIKNVFYLGNTHEYTNAYAAGEEGIDPIDVSAFVSTFTKSKAKGQGLAIYKVHAQVSGAGGEPLLATETGNFMYGLSVKPFTNTGDQLTGQLVAGDTLASNDLLVYGAQFMGGAQAASGMATSVSRDFLTPSQDVPYIVVRDTIFQIMQTNTVFFADVHISVRMECATITLDSATVTQLLRTQTA